eukprot:815022-Lingulodinium_polyedra.AAC.1
MDYCYIKQDGADADDEGPGIICILVLRDDKTGCYGATVVPRKGPDPYVVEYCAGFLRMLGYRRLIYKSDNEPAILSLKRTVLKAVEAEVVEQESPPYDPQANGLAE